MGYLRRIILSECSNCGENHARSKTSCIFGVNVWGHFEQLESQDATRLFLVARDNVPNVLGFS